MTVSPPPEPVTVVACENCGQKLRLPRRTNRLQVTCPKCRYQFYYQSYPLGLSSASLKALLVGLVGGVAGFALAEISQISEPAVRGLVTPGSALLPAGSGLLPEATTTAALFGLGLGALLGAAQGYLQNNRPRMVDGALVGGYYGLAGGLLAGLAGQPAFSLLRSPGQWNAFALFRPGSTSLDPAAILARVIGWAVFGALLGVILSLRQPDPASSIRRPPASPTSGAASGQAADFAALLRSVSPDLWRGLAAGLIGGALGGLLFDLLGAALPVGGAGLARVVAFLLLGGALGLALFRIKRGPLVTMDLLARLSRLRIPTRASLARLRPASLRGWLDLLPALGGLLLLVAGFILSIGNLSGALPTLPFAGLLLLVTGGLLVLPSLSR